MYSSQAPANEHEGDSTIIYHGLSHTCPDTQRDQRGGIIYLITIRAFQGPIAQLSVNSLLHSTPLKRITAGTEVPGSESTCPSHGCAVGTWVTFPWTFAVCASLKPFRFQFHRVEQEARVRPDSPTTWTTEAPTTQCRPETPVKHHHVVNPFSKRNTFKTRFSLGGEFIIFAQSLGWR